MPTRRHVTLAAAALERRLDAIRGGIRGKMMISPYRGLGRANEMLVRGRVLADKNITRATEAESTLRNLVNTWRRFESDEVANAKVRATYRDAVGETITNGEGHFEIILKPQEIAQHVLWHEVGLALPDSGVTAVAHVLLPSPAASFAVISDIDDTIVRTGATSLLSMVRSVINNAASRLPFKGVAKLYRALQDGRNPIFYVSSSPWNLYELFDDYMKHNGIPPGPMFLQDWGISETQLITAAHDTHKLAQIQTIVDYYPDMKFVLIGDSGQRDPEIYLKVIQTHPKRILAAIIRDVTVDVRDQTVARIIEEAHTAGVEMIYVDEDSDEALEHAKRLGLAS